MKQEIEIVERMLEKLINSIPNVVKQDRGVFKVGKRTVRLIVKRNRVYVEPIGYYYSSPEDVMKEEFELRDAIESYLKPPRLYFEERRENGETILYCMLEGAGIEIKFRPKWNELLNGVNRMIFTEYKNALRRKKNKMQDILDALQKITRRTERFCKEIERKRSQTM